MTSEAELALVYGTTLLEYGYHSVIFLLVFCTKRACPMLSPNRPCTHHLSSIFVPIKRRKSSRSFQAGYHMGPVQGGASANGLPLQGYF